MIILLLLLLWKQLLGCRLKRLTGEVLVTAAKAAISGGEALSMRVDTYVQSVKLLLGLSLRSYESDG